MYGVFSHMKCVEAHMSPSGVIIAIAMETFLLYSTGC